MTTNASVQNNILADLRLAPIQLDPRRAAAIEIAETVYALVCQYMPPAKLYPGPVFTAIPQLERVVFRFSPQALGNTAFLPAVLIRAIREQLARRVIAPRGTSVPYLVVGYASLESGAVPLQAGLQSLPLDLSQQPGSTHVPLGMSAKGPEWRDIVDLDAVLIGGPRGFGKTRVMHAWIQALLHGGMAELLLWDSKNGNEFGRYAGLPHVTVITSGPLLDLNSLDDDQPLREALGRLQQEIVSRINAYAPLGATNLAEYNARAAQKLLPLVVFVDEAAGLSASAADTFSRLIRLARSYGLHPVVGIQRPDAEVMRGQMKANLPTRICLPTTSHQDSKIILERTGAEKLPKVKGRCLVNDGADLLEVQAFTVTLPEPRGMAAAPHRSTSILTREELRLVQCALNPQRPPDQIGRVSENDLMSWGMVRNQARQIGIDWQHKGWLRNGPHNARYVTDDLKALAGAGAEAKSEKGV